MDTHVISNGQWEMQQYKLKPIHLKYTFINNEIYYHHLKETTKHEHYYTILLGFCRSIPIVVHDRKYTQCIHTYVRVMHTCIYGIPVSCITGNLII